MVEISTARATVGYGAGPVSVQLTRGRPLVETPTESDSSGVVAAPPRPGRDRNADDRLALKHWPRGHRVLVCSLTGGTGRTTVAALLASTLAGMPFAHLWPPALLVDTTRRRSPHDHQDDAAEMTGEDRVDLASLLGVRSPLQVQTTSAGIAVLRAKDTEQPVLSRQLCTAVSIVQDCFAPVIIDTPCGPPGSTRWTRGVPAGFSVVLVVRPDEYSLADAAQALVWMHDQHLVSKQQVIVVVNHGAGPPTGRTRTAAAALAVRCRGLHHLPADPHLGPDPTPPTARPVPARLRLRLAQICLDIWHTSQTPTHRPDPHVVDHPQGEPVNTPRISIRLSAGLTSALLIAATPGLAWSEPTAAPSEASRKVVDGPDLAAGARNAPGAAAIESLIDTIGFYGIIACLVGLLLSALILVIGPRIGFDRASTVGKVGIFASLGGAFLIGISATLVNFFYNAGA